MNDPYEPVKLARQAFDEMAAEIRAGCEPGKKKSFLECMFNDLDDIRDGNDKEVKQELISQGIDLKKCRRLFLATIKRCKAASEDSGNDNKP